MTRLAKRRPVHYYEEPVFGETPRLRRRTDCGVNVVQPEIPEHLSFEERNAALSALLDEFLESENLRDPILWYYTPMMLDFSDHVRGTVVYDCMDELSLFAGAHPELPRHERALLRRADVVFTGGRSLYYSKRRAHSNVHCFPSAVDASHFQVAQRPVPADMAGMEGRKIGFYGVIDERFDCEYVQELAKALPDWQIVLLGPVVKIDPARVPKAANIHHLGMKSYAELPAYLEHWDVAFLPFALNDATRFISPTKTLEYLAARKPVISTPIADVVDPYGTDGVVMIGEDAQTAARLARKAVEVSLPASWHRSVDGILNAASWDRTVADMERHLASAARPVARVAG